MELRIKIVNENAKGLYVTDNSDKDDSGLDLYVLEDTKINLGETVFIDLGIQCEMLKNNKNVGYYLYPRSSISKTPLILANSVGIIDAGYRGELGIAVDNIRSEPFVVERGWRLVQVCSPGLMPFIVSYTDTLNDTVRGEGGFGSTGQ